MTALRSPFAAGFADEAAVDLAATMKMLADPTRLKILALLHERGPMGVSEVEACLPLKQPTVSHHLRVLREAGLITTRREGVRAFSSLRSGRCYAIGHPTEPLAFCELPLHHKGTHSATVERAVSW